MDRGEFVEFKALPESSNEAIQGGVWEVWDLIFQRSIGVVGWSGSFKTYSFAPYHVVLLQPEHLEDIARMLREENDKRGSNNARDTVFGRD